MKRKAFYEREPFQIHALWGDFFLKSWEKKLATKSLCESRIGDNTSITSSDIVVLTFSAHIFESVWITDREDMTPFSSASTENLLSVYSAFSSEESVRTKAFSLFEFRKHKSGK